jgi:hypothetical protein
VVHRKTIEHRHVRRPGERQKVVDHHHYNYQAPTIYCEKRVYVEPRVYEEPIYE